MFRLAPGLALGGIFRLVGARDAGLLSVLSLRNVAVAAPYFHDGSTQRLLSAVRSIARAQLDILLDQRTPGDIATFLRTLTGRHQNQRLNPASTHPTR